MLLEHGCKLFLLKFEGGKRCVCVCHCITVFLPLSVSVYLTLGSGGHYMIYDMYLYMMKRLLPGRWPRIDPTLT